MVSQTDKSLEAGNPHVYNPDDEIKEVSGQLVSIRKKHDITKESNLKKRIEVEKLRKELDKIEAAANLTEKDQRTVTVRSDQLKSALEITKQKVEEELQNKRIYEHMLHRMKQNQLAMEMKSNELHSKLKSSRQILESEKERSRKGKEQLYQSKQMLKEIRSNWQVEKLRNEEKIQQLEHGVRLRQEAAERRQERTKRQEDIAEAAAHQDKDAQEIRLREILNLHRFWYNFLKWKLDKEMQESAEVEEAFQQIKTATGIGNVNYIIEMFLTREEHHSSLMQAVAEAESKLDELRVENERTRHEYQELQLVLGEGVSREFIKDVENLDEQITEQSRAAMIASEKLDRASEVYDQVRSWGMKVLNKLKPQHSIEVSPASRVEETSNTLKELYESIQGELDGMLEPLLDRKEEVQEILRRQAGKKTDDIVAEITTEEFLVKNKRVKMRNHEEFEDEEEEEGNKRRNNKQNDRKYEKSDA